MIRNLLNRADALERLRPIHRAACETPTSPLVTALHQAIDDLERTQSNTGAYIPRDPAVSIALSFLDALHALSPLDIRSRASTAIAASKSVHPFPEDKAPCVPLGASARLVVAGDWGSGIQRAVNVSLHMRRFVEEGMRQGRDTHVMSLGDVYYSGLEHEYVDWFLPHWPVRPSETGSIGSWALNGNHDMYAGGHGYFETLLGDTRFSA